MCDADLDFNLDFRYFKGTYPQHFTVYKRISTHSYKMYGGTRVSKGKSETRRRFHRTTMSTPAKKKRTTYTSAERLRRRLGPGGAGGDLRNDSVSPGQLPIVNRGLYNGPSGSSNSRSVPNAKASSDCDFSSNFSSDFPPTSPPTSPPKILRGPRVAMLSTPTAMEAIQMMIPVRRTGATLFNSRPRGSA